MSLLPFQRASEIPTEGAALTRWLVEGLWSEQAVGILGGEPKCCKSFLALDLAVSVASGTACLRRYPVRQAGRVLIFPAEDSLAVVRRRLEGICAAAGMGLASLPVDVITAPVLRLDSEADRQRLTNTVASLRPVLLILDPMIRLHRLDENDASQIAVLLSYLRELQRRFQVAVLLVHHARKDSHGSRPGQALRGSSELHGWGDSNLYMRRRGSQLTLTTEHRAAPSQDNIPLQLTESGSALALTVVTGLPAGAAPAGSTHPAPAAATPLERVRQVLAELQDQLPPSASANSVACALLRWARAWPPWPARVSSSATPEAIASAVPPPLEAFPFPRLYRPRWEGKRERDRPRRCFLPSGMEFGAGGEDQCARRRSRRSHSLTGNQSRSISRFRRRRYIK